MTTRGFDGIVPVLIDATKEFNVEEWGLTKRELFAILLYAASWSNPNLGIKCSAETAVREADALIEALSKEQQ